MIVSLKIFFIYTNVCIELNVIVSSPLNKGKTIKHTQRLFFSLVGSIKLIQFFTLIKFTPIPVQIYV